MSYLSIVASFYPSNRELLIGLFEAAIGAGMMLGPFIGTVLFAIGGYVFMLVSFGVVFIVLAFFVPYIFPEMLDLYTNMAPPSSEQQQDKESNSGQTINEVMKEVGIST